MYITESWNIHRECSDINKLGLNFFFGVRITDMTRVPFVAFPGNGTPDSPSLELPCKSQKEIDRWLRECVEIVSPAFSKEEVLIAIKESWIKAPKRWTHGTELFPKTRKAGALDE